MCNIAIIFAREISIWCWLQSLVEFTVLDYLDVNFLLPSLPFVCIFRRLFCTLRWQYAVIIASVIRHFVTVDGRVGVCVRARDLVQLRLN